jgi:hypothetical protein
MDHDQQVCKPVCCDTKLERPFDPLASQQFRIDVQRELIRARGKHGPMNSAHEGFAILLEEVDEVKAEVFHGKDRAKLRAELIQVAAMAQRMAEDLNI